MKNKFFYIIGCIIFEAVSILLIDIIHPTSTFHFFQIGMSSLVMGSLIYFLINKYEKYPKGGIAVGIFLIISALGFASIAIYLSQGYDKLGLGPSELWEKKQNDLFALFLIQFFILIFSATVIALMNKSTKKDPSFLLPFYVFILQVLCFFFFTFLIYYGWFG